MPERYPVYPEGTVHGPLVEKGPGGMPQWQRHPRPKPIAWVTPGVTVGEIMKEIRHATDRA